MQKTLSKQKKNDTSHSEKKIFFDDNILEVNPKKTIHCHFDPILHCYVLLKSG